ncbi:MAG: lysine biosynthesis protein LysW [Anaerolineae bacterium]|nr:lysine biosynthesis protein LysW [Anaerolineae bacterium]
MFAICPSCGEDIKLRDNLKIAQTVVCPYCETDLEVIDLDPVELDWAYYDDEEWEEDWEDDEDDDL